MTSVQLRFDLAIIGTGMRGLRQMTMEQRDVLAAARHVLVSYAHASRIDEIAALAPDADVVDLHQLASEHRHETHDVVVRRVLDVAAEGSNTVLVDYGHPLVYNQMTSRIVAAARAARLEPVVLSGISSIAEIFSHLEIDIFERQLQVLHSESLIAHDTPVNPELDCIVMRIGAVARPGFARPDGPQRARRRQLYGELQRHLERFYEPDHQALVVTLDTSAEVLPDRSVAGSTWSIRIRDLGRIGADLPLASTLYIPGRSAAASEPARRAPRYDQVGRHVLIRDDFLPTDLHDALLDALIDHEASYVDAPTRRGSSPHRKGRQLPASVLGAPAEAFLDHLRGTIDAEGQRWGVEPGGVDELQLAAMAWDSGSYYRPHRDQSLSGPGASRKLSAVYFLHRQPRSFTGGRLHVYATDLDGEPSFDDAAPTCVDPIANRLVLFESGAYHEVRPTEVPTGRFGDCRFSLVAWAI